MTERVPMRPAYEWTCPDCGTDHFVSCMVADIPETEHLEFAKQNGLVDEWVSELPEELKGMKQAFVTYPDAVRCPDCNQLFPTQHYSDPLEGD